MTVDLWYTYGEGYLVAVCRNCERTKGDLRYEGRAIANVARDDVHQPCHFCSLPSPLPETDSAPKRVYPARSPGDEVVLALGSRPKATIREPLKNGLYEADIHYEGGSIRGLVTPSEIDYLPESKTRTP